MLIEDLCKECGITVPRKNLHQLFNTKERSLKSVYNKQYRYFYMLQEYENKVYCTK